MRTPKGLILGLWAVAGPAAGQTVDAFAPVLVTGAESAATPDAEILANDAILGLTPDHRVENFEDGTIMPGLRLLLDGAALDLATAPTAPNGTSTLRRQIQPSPFLRMDGITAMAITPGVTDDRSPRVSFGFDFQRPVTSFSIGLMNVFGSTSYDIDVDGQNLSDSAALTAAFPGVTITTTSSSQLDQRALIRIQTRPTDGIQRVEFDLSQPSTNDGISFDRVAFLPENAAPVATLDSTNAVLDAGGVRGLTASISDPDLAGNGDPSNVARFGQAYETIDGVLRLGTLDKGGQTAADQITPLDLSAGLTLADAIGGGLSDVQGALSLSLTGTDSFGLGTGDVSAGNPIAYTDTATQLAEGTEFTALFDADSRLLSVSASLFDADLAGNAIVPNAAAAPFEEVSWRIVHDQTVLAESLSGFRGSGVITIDHSVLADSLGPGTLTLTLESASLASDGFFPVAQADVFVPAIPLPHTLALFFPVFAGMCRHRCRTARRLG